MRNGRQSKSYPESENEVKNKSKYIIGSIYQMLLLMDIYITKKIFSTVSNFQVNLF